ncbi:DNA polymerase III subunit gamma/tau [Paralcaligenes ureilyticus]|uniref:DNA polymerase III subunit gamma/tau n=1 Tax=Paralcaligenes ureilyticus TaxID=627131 RepID=A0A4R3M7R4_9BURK|nr:DNA polymerase III subunit gamma/tau [Paralcaligenes ureilyticus]TCT09524.1 DNA polymerase III tau subunit [Paralcaligenes ureilyticus]
MTYLVLARKWRPRSFDTLIGQDHVVRALTHALSTQRLHHAWLFTGTRGVGKTTLSRILAKSLNCETGITATPCGVCRACTEIDAGRFVDYLELDAASNRGVDEMTQLLEAAVYAPSVGRFKVYMIDEVHMLSGHAFNAMLKTLEEPPPHVKFILATTDPQKIPVTILSRCLQFNLKLMTAESMVAYLQNVLEHENIPCETPALRLLAQAAAGSMRDALSLTDQAIAYSAGNLTVEAVQGMLGTIDQRHLIRLLQALSAASAQEVLLVADELATRGLSYSGALADLAVLLSRIAIEQRVGGTISHDDPLADDMVGLAGQMHPDLVQLFYSVAVHSRNELTLAPDEYAGFVMACLRMLALAPAPTGEGGGERRSIPPAAQAAPDLSLRVAAPAEPVATAAAPQPVPLPERSPVSAPLPASALPVDGAHKGRRYTNPPELSGREPLSATESIIAPEAIPASKSVSASKPAPVSESVPESVSAPALAPAPRPDTVPAWDDEPGVDVAPVDEADIMDAAAPDDYDLGAPLDLQADMAPAFAAERSRAKTPKLRSMNAKAWPALAAQLPLTGLAAELARQSEWLGAQGDQVNLRVAVRSLAESPGKSRLCTVLSEYFGSVISLQVEYGETGDETAHAVEQARRASLQQEAERAVRDDPVVQALIGDFGAQVVPGSIRASVISKAA